MARPFLLEEGRRLRHRRVWPRWRLGAGARRHPQCGDAADRLFLPRRLCDADRGRRPDHLVHVRSGRPVMTAWPIPAVGTFRPAIGTLLVYLLARGSDEA